MPKGQLGKDHSSVNLRIFFPIIARNECELIMAAHIRIFIMDLSEDQWRERVLENIVHALVSDYLDWLQLFAPEEQDNFDLNEDGSIDLTECDYRMSQIHFNLCGLADPQWRKRLRCMFQKLSPEAQYPPEFEQAMDRIIKKDPFRYADSIQDHCSVCSFFQSIAEKNQNQR